MLQYVNSFACTIDRDQKNFIIHLRQNEPIVPDDDSEEIGLIPNEIINIIMDESCAEGLANSILRLLSSEDGNTD